MCSRLDKEDGRFDAPVLPHGIILTLVIGAGVTVILAAIGAVTVWGWL